MAEIKITKKAPAWPWILLLLIVIAGIIFLYFYGDPKEDDVLDTSSKEVTFTENQTILSFSQINS